MESQETNPLLQYDFGTPHDTIPFDKIKTEHFKPALERGMELEKEEAMNKQKQQQKLEAMKPKEPKPVKDVSPVKEVVNSPIPEVKPVVKEQPKKGQWLILMNQTENFKYMLIEI